MPDINYLILGSSPKVISFVPCSHHDKVGHILRTVHTDCKLDCGPSMLEAYRVDVPLTPDWKLGTEWTDERLNALCTEERRMAKPAPMNEFFQGEKRTEMQDGAVQILIQVPAPQNKFPDPIASIGSKPSKHVHPRLLGLGILHEILWGKQDSLTSQIFTNINSTPDTGRDNQVNQSTAFSYTVLSLVEPLNEFFNRSEKPEGFHEHSLLPCRERSLVVRQAYKDMDPILDSLDEAYQQMLQSSELPDKPPGVLLTGNPGIGKSHYLSHLLVKCLLRGRRVIYQDEEDMFYLFTEEGVSNYPVGRMREYSHDNTIWALFDTKPPKSIVKLPWLVIHVSSPLVDNYKYWVKQRAGVIYYLSAWSWQEVEATVRLKVPNIDSDSLSKIRELYNLYGPIPRLLLDELRNLTNWGFDWDETTEAQEAKLSRKVDNFLERYTTVGPEDMNGMSGSHTIIVIVPVRLGKKASVGRTCYTTLATPHIGKALAMAAAKNLRYLTQGQRLYSQLCEIPQALSAREWLIEGLIHARLTRGGEVQLTPLRAGRALEKITFDCSETGAIPRIQGLSDLCELLRESPGSENVNPAIANKYLRLTMPSLPFVDGLAVVRMQHSYRLVLFQVTTNITHKINYVGLERLWNALPSNVRRTAPIYYVWLPTDVKIWKHQVEGDTSNVWNRRLVQFVIAFDRNELWSTALAQ